MRLAWCAVLAIACSSPNRTPQPKPARPFLVKLPGHECPRYIFPDTTGWCAQPARRRPDGTWLQISLDLTRVERLAADPQEFGRTATLDRASGVRVSSIDLTPRIANNRVQLRTRPTSCHDTGLGCIHRCWSDPGETIFEDPIPPQGCIAASLELPGGLVISVGGQLRTYARSEHGIATRASLVPSALTAIKKLDDSVLLQDRLGVLWQASWKADDAGPTLRSLARESEILTAGHESRGVFYAIATDALLAIDSETLATRWRHAGEVWSQVYDWELKRHYILVIDRPRATIHMLDDSGNVVRSKVVYEGADLVEAHLTPGMKGLLVTIVR